MHKDYFRLSLYKNNVLPAYASRSNKVYQKRIRFFSIAYQIISSTIKLSCCNLGSNKSDWLYRNAKQKDKRMASLQCKDYETALDIAMGFYEFDDTIDPKDKVYFQKRGYNAWMVLLPIDFR